MSFGDDGTESGRLHCSNARTRAQNIQKSEYDDTQGSTALEKFWIRDYSFDTYLWYDEITDFDPNSDEETLDAELRDKGVSESRLEDWIETRKYFDWQPN